MTKNFLISKQDKEKFYLMVFQKHITGLHGGIIGDYNKDQCIITLLDEWIPYLDEYGIKTIPATPYIDSNNEIKYKTEI